MHRPVLVSPSPPESQTWPTGGEVLAVPEQRMVGGAGGRRRPRKKTPGEIQVAATRARQSSRVHNLTLAINDLKQELNDLALRRELLHTRAFYSRLGANGSIQRTAARYFFGFGQGYRGAISQPDQYAFVHSIADEDLTLGVTGLGVDVLMDQWRRYADLLHIRRSVLKSVELVSAGSDDSTVLVKCALEFHGVFTRAAVDAVFPGAQRDPMLMLQVLGREMICPMLFHLYFDGDDRLVRHDAEADFLTAVQNAMAGDSIAAARFLEDACIGQESMIGPIVVHVEDEEAVAMGGRLRSKKSRTSISYICNAGGEDTTAEDRFFDPVEVSDDEEGERSSQGADAHGGESCEDSPDARSAFEDDSSLVDARARHSLAFLMSP